MISEDEARAIAQSYLEPRSAAGTFRFDPTPQRRPDDWVMVFDRVAEDGSVIDGPIMVLVDKRTGRARTLEEDIKERSIGG